MRFRLVVAVIMALIFIGAGPFCFSAGAGDLAFLRQETVQPLRQIDADYFQEQIEEEHPRYDGLVLISKADHSLEFALLDEGQNVLWRMPARSSWVVLSQNAPRIAMVGKSEHEGYGPGLGKTVHEGIDVYDVSGNLVYRVEDTGPIGQVFLSPGGSLLVSTAGDVRLYDLQGQLLWIDSPPPSDVKFLGQGDYVRALSWDARSGIFTLRLLESSSGALSKEWQYKRSEERSILSVHPKENWLVMSEYVNSTPPQWDVVIYDMSNWEPVRTLRRLPAGPFSEVWNERDSTMAVLLRRPRIDLEQNPGEILLGLWNLADGSFITRSLGVQKVDFRRDGLTWDPLTEEYTVKIGSMVTVFGH